MSLFKKLKKYAYRYTRSFIISINYYLGNYKHKIWIIGDGRSGTTWLSDIINWKGNFREMFEPFHPKEVIAAQPYVLHQYFRVNDDSDTYFTRLMNSIFTGKFKNKRVDAINQNIFYKGILIKDIFANLIAAWVQKRHPDLKIILLVRNPFEVALSKQNKKDWIWMEDPKLFLEQKELYEDFLQPFEEIIQNVSDDYIERQIMIWAIIHYVLFKQLNKDNLHIVFYENLLGPPKEEIQNLLKYIYSLEDVTIPTELLSTLKTPSRVASENIIKNKLPTSNWKNKLTPLQLQNGLNILSAFNLHKIYGKNFKPNKTEIEKLLQD